MGVGSSKAKLWKELTAHTINFDSTTIANANPTVAAPTAPTDTIAGTPQSFSFAVPEDTDGTITQFVIDFGDGNSVTFDNSSNPNSDLYDNTSSGISLTNISIAGDNMTLTISK